MGVTNQFKSIYCGGVMNKRTVKYILERSTVDSNTEAVHTYRELYLEPSSKAYELYMDKKYGELDKHLEGLLR